LREDHLCAEGEEPRGREVEAVAEPEKPFVARDAEESADGYGAEGARGVVALGEGVGGGALHVLRGEVAEEVDGDGAEELGEVGASGLDPVVGAEGGEDGGRELGPEPAGARDGFCGGWEGSGGGFWRWWSVLLV